MTKASERFKALRFKYDVSYREKLVAEQEAKLTELVRKKTRRGEAAAKAAIKTALTLPDEVLVPDPGTTLAVPPAPAQRHREGWSTPGGGRTWGATINGRPTTDFDRLRYFNPEAYAALMRDVKHHVCPLCGGKLDKDWYCARDDATVKPREEQRVGSQFSTVEEQEAAMRKGVNPHMAHIENVNLTWSCPDCGAELYADTMTKLDRMITAHVCPIKDIAPKEKP